VRCVGRSIDEAFTVLKRASVCSTRPWVRLRSNGASSCCLGYFTAAGRFRSTPYDVTGVRGSCRN